MKKLLLLVSMILIIFISGCSSDTKITPEKAKEMLADNEEIVLVDVRTREEFNEERIPGAKLLPVTVVQTQAKYVIPDKNGTYIIYCRSGNRSNEATKLLKEMGYKNVYDLGGIIDWPYETVRG